MGNKRGDTLSMNVIIIAALALLVLVIVALILTGRMGRFNWESRDCRNKGGTCYAKITADPYDSCPEGLQYFGSWLCHDESGSKLDDRVCCITGS